MGDHRIVLGGSTDDLDTDTKRQRFHCTGCDLSGNVSMRPARTLAALLDVIRAAHETEEATDDHA